MFALGVAGRLWGESGENIVLSRAQLKAEICLVDDKTRAFQNLGCLLQHKTLRGRLVCMKERGLFTAQVAIKYR